MLHSLRFTSVANKIDKLLLDQAFNLKIAFEGKDEHVSFWSGVVWGCVRLPLELDVESRASFPFPKGGGEMEREE